MSWRFQLTVWLHRAKRQPLDCLFLGQKRWNAATKPRREIDTEMRLKTPAFIIVCIPSGLYSAAVSCGTHCEFVIQSTVCTRAPCFCLERQECPRSVQENSWCLFGCWPSTLWTDRQVGIATIHNHWKAGSKATFLRHERKESKIFNDLFWNKKGDHVLTADNRFYNFFLLFLSSMLSENTTWT